MKITERIFNAETGETIDIERDETTAEKKAREKHKIEVAEMIEQENARIAQRQAILDRLGLTADEAKLLLG